MLQFNFIMTCIIHKILVLFKITRILKPFLRSIIEFLFKETNCFFFSQRVMMKISRLEEDKNIEENIIKDVRNLFRLKNFKKEPNDTAIKDISNLFRLKKEKKSIKDKILRDVRNPSRHEEKGENYYKPTNKSK